MKFIYVEYQYKPTDFLAGIQKNYLKIKWFKITWLPQETREFSTGLFQTPRNCCSQIKQNKGLFVDETTHAGGTSHTQIIFFNWFDNGTPVADIR